MRGGTQRPTSFREGLTITFALGVVAAVIATTVASVVLTQVLLTRQFRAQALAEAALAARESVYPLLGAPSEAHRVVDNMLGWPYVTYVALDDASSGHLLAEAGRKPSMLGQQSEIHGDAGGPWIAVETSEYCQVVVPLMSAPAAAPFGESQSSTAAQRLGQLQMVFTKAALHELTVRVGVSCSCVGVVIAVLILLWVATRIRVLTVPLARLAALMEQDTPGGRANVVGVTEVRQIATAFNRMRDRIDEHTEGLEREVEARTREWRSASEAAQQAERYKTTLLRASTHEMKMPLHLIELHVRQALHELEFLGPEADHVRKSLESIVQAAKELLTRIVKILNAARAAGASHALIKEQFDVPRFIDALRERAEALANSQGDELVVQWTGPVRVYADREKLFEIASELLMNACKFTRDGVVRLALEVTDRSFNLEVTDTGCGIPDTEQESVWLEFHQGSRGGSPTYPGQGLGLSMVRQLVHALQGTVALSSAVGVGTTIRVLIPIELPEELVEIG